MLLAPELSTLLELVDSNEEVDDDDDSLDDVVDSTSSAAINVDCLILELVSIELLLLERACVTLSPTIGDSLLRLEIVL